MKTAYAPRYFDRYGNPLDMRAWCVLFEDMAYRRIGYDDIAPYVVSTVWLGIDHGFGRTAQPLIFETMVFGPGGHSDEREQLRVATEAEADANHAAMVAKYTRLVAEAPPAAERRGFEFL